MEFAVGLVTFYTFCEISTLIIREVSSTTGRFLQVELFDLKKLNETASDKSPTFIITVKTPPRWVFDWRDYTGKSL